MSSVRTCTKWSTVTEVSWQPSATYIYTAKQVKCKKKALEFTCVTKVKEFTRHGLISFANDKYLIFWDNTLVFFQINEKLELTCTQRCISKILPTYHSAFSITKMAKCIMFIQLGILHNSSFKNSRFIHFCSAVKERFTMILGGPRFRNCHF